MKGSISDPYNSTTEVRKQRVESWNFLLAAFNTPVWFLGNWRLTTMNFEGRKEGTLKEMNFEDLENLLLGEVETLLQKEMERGPGLQAFFIIMTSPWMRSEEVCLLKARRHHNFSSRSSSMAATTHCHCRTLISP